MNKKYIIGTSIGIILFGSVGIIGAKLLIENTIKEKQNILEIQFNKITKNNDIKVSLKNIENNVGLFESTGTYKIEYININDNNYNGNYILNYNIKNNLNTLFGKDIEFTAISKIEGNILKKLQIKTNKEIFSKVNGVIKNDGSFIFNQNIENISLVIPKTEYLEQDKTKPKEDNVQGNIKNITNEKTGMLSTFKNINSNIEYIAQKEEVITSIKYNKLKFEDLEDPTDQINSNGVVLNYAFNINQLDLGKFLLKIDSIDNGTEQFKLNGLELEASAIKKENKFDIKISSKIKNLNAFTEKNSELEFGYSLLGIDNRVLDIYKKTTKLYASGGELNDEELNSAKLIVKDSIQSGFIFSIDKIKYKNEKSTIDFSGKYEIVPFNKDKDKEFSFINQTKFGMKLVSEGELSNLINMILIDKIPMNLENINNKLLISLNYDNGDLNINNTKASEEINQTIKTLLMNMDIQWGFSNDLSKKEEILITK